MNADERRFETQELSAFIRVHRRLNMRLQQPAKCAAPAQRGTGNDETVGFAVFAGAVGSLGGALAGCAGARRNGRRGDRSDFRPGPVRPAAPEDRRLGGALRAGCFELFRTLPGEPREPRDPDGAGAAGRLGWRDLWKRRGAYAHPRGPALDRRRPETRLDSDARVRALWISVDGPGSPLDRRRRCDVCGPDRAGRHQGSAGGEGVGRYGAGHAARSAGGGRSGVGPDTHLGADVLGRGIVLPAGRRADPREDAVQERPDRRAAGYQPRGRQRGERLAHRTGFADGRQSYGRESADDAVRGDGIEADGSGLTGSLAAVGSGTARGPDHLPLGRASGPGEISDFLLTLTRAVWSEFSNGPRRWDARA